LSVDVITNGIKELEKIETDFRSKLSLGLAPNEDEQEELFSEILETVNTFNDVIKEEKRSKSFFKGLLKYRRILVRILRRIALSAEATVTVKLLPVPMIEVAITLKIELTTRNK